MSEGTKRVVDVAFVKVTKHAEAETERTLIPTAPPEHVRYFTDKDDAALEKEVRFGHHEMIAANGGADGVEVLFSRPFPVA